jgi:hypothetical protein
VARFGPVASVDFCRESRENPLPAPYTARLNTGYQLNDGGYAEFTVADAAFCFPSTPSDVRRCTRPHRSYVAEREIDWLTVPIGWRRRPPGWANLRVRCGGAHHRGMIAAVNQGREVFALRRPTRRPIWPSQVRERSWERGPGQDYSPEYRPPEPLGQCHHLRVRLGPPRPGSAVPCGARRPSSCAPAST